MSIEPQSSANPTPIKRQFSANPEADECRSVSNEASIHSIPTTNHYHPKPNQCQPNTNQTPIRHQSCSKWVPIRFHSSANPFQYDTNPFQSVVPINHNPVSGQVSILSQSIPIQCKSNENQISIKLQSIAIWCLSGAILMQMHPNPVPIHPNFNANPM